MRECTCGVSQSCVQPLPLSWKQQMLLPSQYPPSLFLHHHSELLILFLGIPLPLVVPLREEKYGLGGVHRSDKYSKVHTLCCPAQGLGAFRSTSERTAASSHPKSSAVLGLCKSTATENLPQPSRQGRKMGTSERASAGPLPGVWKSQFPYRDQRRNADVSACALLRVQCRRHLQSYTHHQLETMENCFTV